MSKETKTVFTSPRAGYSARTGVGVATFEIEGLEAREDIRNEEYRNLYKKFQNENACINVANFWVPMWGEGHNLYPQEVRELIQDNKLLPGIINKSIDFLYGKGPVLFTESIANGQLTRTLVADKQIQDWLDSWEEKGHQSYQEYLKNLITDYYYVQTCCTQYHFLKTRRLQVAQSISALSYVGSDEARLATDRNYTIQRIKESDCKHVIVGDWTRIGSQDFKVFNRFDPSKPLAYANPIAFNSDKTFGKWVYAYNDWFNAIYEWVKASNLTPRYLNSYLKNALNAHVHVKIPMAWYSSQKTILQGICQSNIIADEFTPLQTEYRGVKLTNDQGVPFAFVEVMMNDLITCELERITKMLSGEGKNQGKLYATTKIGDEGWEFDEFPGKFKEYFDSVIKYDERADKVTLAALGMNASISNVENDGVISKSGSDVYYNYIIYLNTLSYPEYFICKELNRAIHLNFPHAKNLGIRIGFNIEIPSKQQEVSPDNRLDKQPVV